MKLMIIESPNKVKKLREILPAGWDIAASVGHIRDLPTNEMGVEAPEFRPAYELTERGRDVVAKLKAKVKQAEVVYLATDPDREGEAIAWHLEQALHLKNPIRITFNAVTAEKVNEAIANPRKINYALVGAQEARRTIDRLVGYMVSPVLSNLTGERLSAGRVQTPAVWLVVDRERQIRAFKETNHFSALLNFADAKTEKEWCAEWVRSPDFISDDAPYFMDRAFAQAVADVRSVEVISAEESTAKRSPPAPFNTSSMQQAASVSLSMDPKRAMDTAQALFAAGHITYHRTDNPNIEAGDFLKIAKVAGVLGLDMAPRPRLFKAPEGAQAGHPGITPTHWELEDAGDTPDQRMLYKLIRIRAIASQLADATYAVRTVVLRGDDVQGMAVHFQGRGRTLKALGWLRLLSSDQTEDESTEEADNPIPALAKGDTLAVDRGELLELRTKAPSRYTLASLVKKLESERIGRPATYAAIMDGIVTRGYIEQTKKNVIPTRTGELIVDSLAGRFAFAELSFTQAIEDQLDQIEGKESSYKATVTRVHSQLVAELDTLHAVASTQPKHACPACGKDLRRVPGKEGPFWGCTAYPDCKTSLPDDNGKPGVRKPQGTSEYACLKCGKPLARRTKKAGKGTKGFDFFGCIGFSEGCTATYPVANGKPDFSKAK